MHGDWNHLIVIVGERGSGKSTYAMKRALQLGRAPAYVLAHDPRGGIQDAAKTWPHGAPPKVRSFPSVAALRAAVKTDATGIMTVYSHGASDELLTFAGELAKSASAAGHATPVLVYFDEGAIVRGMSRHRLSDGFADVVAAGRHSRIGMIVTVQSAKAIHYEILALSTEIVMFRVQDRKLLARLEEKVPAAIVAKLPTLPNHRFIVYNR